MATNETKAAEQQSRTAQKRNDQQTEGSGQLTRRQMAAL